MGDVFRPSAKLSVELGAVVSKPNFSRVKASSKGLSNYADQGVVSEVV